MKPAAKTAAKSKPTNTEVDVDINDASIKLQIKRTPNEGTIARINKDPNVTLLVTFPGTPYVGPGNRRYIQGLDINQRSIKFSLEDLNRAGVDLTDSAKAHKLTAYVLVTTTNYAESSTFEAKGIAKAEAVPYDEWAAAANSVTIEYVEDEAMRARPHRRPNRPAGAPDPNTGEMPDVD